VTSAIESELIGIAHEWDRAMVANEADVIGRYMADEWVIVGSDGRMSDKATFLELVRSGALSHDVMTSDDLIVRVYAEAAVLVARGVSGGRYRGHRFLEIERSSNVFVKQDGQWRCVLTHLSRLAPEPAPASTGPGVHGVENT
jgi:ketosteroid isomerase-like protein